MRALTVRQPWAQLIALGVKTIETRSWATKYRGPLVIHAGLSCAAMNDRVGGYFTRHSYGSWRLYGPRIPSEGMPLPLGAIIGTCNLVDVVPIVHGKSPWDKRLPPICLVHVNDKMWHHVGPSAADVTDQLPYGDFPPGRYAWLLEDVKPTTDRCPACWGHPNVSSTRIEGGSEACRHCNRILTFNFMARPAEPCSCDAAKVERCPICKGKGTCDPIPAKGKQGLWEWTPGGAA